MASRKLIIGILIMSAVVVLDTLAQAWVFSTLEENEKFIELLPFLNLVQVWNHGVSFGMFNKLAYGQWILSAFALIISLFLARLLQLAANTIEIVAYSLIIGGALGNVIDRVFYGAVADYIDFHFFNYHWPSFNLTDSAIFVGVMLLLILNMKNTKSTSSI